MSPKYFIAPLLLGAGIFAADPVQLTGPAKVFDSQLNSVEREVVSLAEAMPAEKYSFAPQHGEFAGVRTFAQQTTHLATVNYLLAAAILGEKSPVELGQNENGPADLKTKDAIVAFLKKSFESSHRAMRMLNDANLMQQVQSPFGKNTTPRLSLASMTASHSMDHYGQMVVYARMCGVIPPASRR